MNKYKNKKVIFEGITFDSKDEAAYYKVLLEKKAKGEILEIILQPKLELIPKFKINGKTIRATTYTPDFLVRYANEQEEYIDVKGYSTQQGELRRKLFLYRIGTNLKWVSKNKKYCTDGTGFVDYFELANLRKTSKKR